MKMVFRAFVLFAAVRGLAAQVQVTDRWAILVQQVWTVEGKVKTLQGDPVRGAKVAIKVSGLAGKAQTLQTDEQGAFRTEFRLSNGKSQGLGLDLTVTKHRYLTVHTIVDFDSSGKTWIIPVTLRDTSEDPNLLSQRDLIDTLAPRLKQPAASDGLSGKEATDYALGVKEFLGQDEPDRALTYLLKVARGHATCVSCSTMLGLAERASNDWDGAERNFTGAIREIRADATKARPEADIAYGVMESWQHQPKNAAGFFLEALKIAPEDPLALMELGRSQLELKNWGAASEDLQKAIAAGCDPEARLMRADALLQTGNRGEAYGEMTAYLAGRDPKKMSPRVRQLWAQAQAGHAEEARSTGAAFSFAGPMEELLHNIPELNGLEPALDQSHLDTILNEAGSKVAASFRDFPNTVSQEQIHQERLQTSGKVQQTQDQEFRYLCLVSPEPLDPRFSEYRADPSGKLATQKGLQDGFMLTAGFTSAALHFHPLYQADSQFRYLGRQRVNGGERFVIAFAQRPSKARMSGEFRMGGSSSTTYSQGLAWIDVDSYQIVRLRLDLLAPLPEVRLERQTTEIDFGAVHFKKYPQEFWLPQRVSVAVDWNGKRLRNEHQYSDFQLANVRAWENENERRPPAPPSNGETGPGSPR